MVGEIARATHALDLADLDRLGLEAALEERGHHASAPGRFSGGSTAAASPTSQAMTDLPREFRESLAARVHADHAGIAARDTVVRRDREVPADARRRPPDRIGLHPRHARDDLLHLDAGRLRDGLRVLPDRQDGADAQPDGRRNCRAGSRARRRARDARHRVQHRPDGDGRTAAQLRRDDEGAPHPGGRARVRRSRRAG